jgi:putative transposase
MKEKPYWGNHFWARGYFVSTIGLDEEMVKRYVKYQEEEEKRIESQQHKFEF